MDFAAILALAQKGASLLSEGRSAFTQVKDAIADGKAALSTSEQSELTALLAQEETETATAIADARSAIAGYRAGS